MPTLTYTPWQFAEAVSYLYTLLEGPEKEEMLRLHQILVAEPESGRIEELARNAPNWTEIIERQIETAALLPEQRERLEDLVRKLRHEPLCL